MENNNNNEVSSNPQPDDDPNPFSPAKIDSDHIQPKSSSKKKKVDNLFSQVYSSVDLTTPQRDKKLIGKNLMDPSPNNTVSDLQVDGTSPLTRTDKKKGGRQTMNSYKHSCLQSTGLMTKEQVKSLLNKH